MFDIFQNISVPMPKIISPIPSTKLNKNANISGLMINIMPKITQNTPKASIYKNVFGLIVLILTASTTHTPPLKITQNATI